VISLQVKDVWKMVCHSNKAQRVLGAELMHALEGPLNPTLSRQDDAEPLPNEPKGGLPDFYAGRPSTSFA
jgi:hypothetical protein